MNTVNKDINKTEAIESWEEAVNIIKKMVQMLDEKPALIVYRTSWNDFRGYLNDKALKIVEEITKGARYFFLSSYSVGDSNNYFVALEMSKKYNVYSRKDNTSPSEPGSHTSYPYNEIELRGGEGGFFKVDRIIGRILFGDYFGPSFKILFLEDDLLKTSKKGKRLYFQEQ